MSDSAAAEVPSPMRVATTAPEPDAHAGDGPADPAGGQARGHHAGQRPGGAERLRVGAVVDPAVEGQQREAVDQLDADDRRRQQPAVVDPEQEREAGGDERGAADEHHGGHRVAEIVPRPDEHGHEPGQRGPAVDGHAGQDRAVEPGLSEGVGSPAQHPASVVARLPSAGPDGSLVGRAGRAEASLRVLRVQPRHRSGLRRARPTRWPPSSCAGASASCTAAVRSG